MTTPVLCIGSVLWDVIARAELPMKPGYDGPGRITRRPGGVAYNVGAALNAQGLSVELLSALGTDQEGQTLVALATEAGVGCRYVTRVSDPTDTYMAIELPDGEVFGAVADCYSLEFAGEQILAPLHDGKIASDRKPFSGVAVIDGNLPERVLAMLGAEGILAQARRIYVPASPGKAGRLRQVLQTGGGTIFVNRTEAQILCETDFPDSRTAATALAEFGVSAIVTDGPRDATISKDGMVMSVTPPPVEVTGVTGAGDAFLAGYLAADLRGEHPAQAMVEAADVAARHISGARQ